MHIGAVQRVTPMQCMATNTRRPHDRTEKGGACAPPFPTPYRHACAVGFCILSSKLIIETQLFQQLLLQAVQKLHQLLQPSMVHLKLFYLDLMQYFERLQQVFVPHQDFPFP